MPTRPRAVGVPILSTIRPGSGRHAMFVVRAMAVVEDRVLCRKIAWIGIEPRVDMLRLDGNEAIVAGGGNLTGRLISDGREGEQIRLARALPVRPQAGDEHVLSGLRLELQDHVFLQFAFSEIAPFMAMSFHVFIESVQKLGRLPRRAVCASGSGIGFVWSRLIGLATVGASHAVDHRSKVGRRRQ